MIIFFQEVPEKIIAVGTSALLSNHDLEKLKWLFGNADIINQEIIEKVFIGPRKEMITPWSTNAVEITQNMGIQGIERIEEFFSSADIGGQYDKMLQQEYSTLDQHIFEINRKPDPVNLIEDISGYNDMEGLALSREEIGYLEAISNSIGRSLTDSEIFGFSQVNSEHCRHKIFNGEFVIDGEVKPDSLFQLIKKTAKVNPNNIISAYKDNVAFIKGPGGEQFAPRDQSKPGYFETREVDSVISLKAETHNFPTTVEPFNGAATGSGGEIRDRMAGGKAGIPLAGTAVYMTPYSRLTGNKINVKERAWLYQNPVEILIKASNGASDFGNKFGQPLICGSLLTFEHQEQKEIWGYDKVIMLAGGIGIGKLNESLKEVPSEGDIVVVMGGDNYRIGMGGSSVSSLNTGELGNIIELNAIQRSNPEMQKRVFNAIRAMSEMETNPIISIHDHGAGGHLNCLSELLEETGGEIEIKNLPIGDPTLSDREVLGNESQERMGLIIKEQDFERLKDVAEREKAPIYRVGKVTNDRALNFKGSINGEIPVQLQLSHLFGSSPKTVLRDQSQQIVFSEVKYQHSDLEFYIESVLSLEAVACKDWLTNKVDRSVTGKVAMQQSCGPVQLPLNNVGVMAIDYSGLKGIATSIGHAPVAGLIDPAKGGRLAITKALTNLSFANLTYGLKGVSLSANWMWPAKNPGEDARLYDAVQAVSDFACELGINIPTGKDSLSMSQKYNDGMLVKSPGTVIISSVAEVYDITKSISPVLSDRTDTSLVYIDFSDGNYELGGSSFAQALNSVGNNSPDAGTAEKIKIAFGLLQDLLKEGLILGGHDVSAGGLITSLLELCFTRNDIGLDLDLNGFNESDIIKILFSENPAVVLQIRTNKGLELIQESGSDYKILGTVNYERQLKIGSAYSFNIDELRKNWFKTSYEFDKIQTSGDHAEKRKRNFNLPLEFIFPNGFTGQFEDLAINPQRKIKSGIKAAIIREKGVNGDREMAWAMHLAGFDVKDVHMTDLISGRENLEDISFITFVGGFSNSDVLGSAKGWAGSFLYNQKAKETLDRFYAREDTLSLGVCNGCQLMMELELICIDQKGHPKMKHNASEKFESSFLNVDILDSDSIMLRDLAGSKLGIWVAHGEGRFQLNGSGYDIPLKYSRDEYPGNPNGSDKSAAAISSLNGRHLAIMPHLERSIYPWNWAYYPESRSVDQVSPWIAAFISARKWVESNYSN